MDDDGVSKELKEATGLSLEAQKAIKENNLESMYYLYPKFAAGGGAFGGSDDSRSRNNKTSTVAVVVAVAAVVAAGYLYLDSHSTQRDAEAKIAIAEHEAETAKEKSAEHKADAAEAKAEAKASSMMQILKSQGSEMLEESLRDGIKDGVKGLLPGASVEPKAAQPADDTPAEMPRGIKEPEPVASTDPTSPAATDPAVNPTEPAGVTISQGEYEQLLAAQGITLEGSAVSISASVGTFDRGGPSGFERNNNRQSKNSGFNPSPEPQGSPTANTGRSDADILQFIQQLNAGDDEGVISMPASASPSIP